MGKKMVPRGWAIFQSSTWIQVRVGTFYGPSEPYWKRISIFTSFFVINLNTTFKTVYPVLSAREVSRKAHHRDHRIDCHQLSRTIEQPQHWQWSVVAGFCQVVTSKPQLQGINPQGFPVYHVSIWALSSWACGLSYIRKYPVNLNSS